MALATAIAFFSGYKTNSVHELAALANRFPRSGVGIHGFFHGGLIVDKGHPADLSGHLQIAAFDSRKYWPSQWEIILLIPNEPAGVWGLEERKAFADLPAPPANEMAHVRDVVYNGFLPAIESSDFASAMTALESLQSTVGGWFAPAQGGSIYGSPLRDQLVKQMRQVGLRGVGQSSWGPTLFGFAQSTLIDSIETNLQQTMGELTQNVQIIRTGPQNQGVFEINRL
jgi:beta-RFAP synthase